MKYDINIDIVAFIIGYATFIFYLWQYMADRKWKRKQFAAEVMNKIKDDDEFRLAVAFIDWRECEILIPDRYITSDEQKKSFKHTYALMASAFDMNLREKLPGTDSFDLKPEEYTIERMIYVDVFERFFQYLEDISSFIKIGLVKWEDIITICYWAEKLYNYKFNDKPIFLDYLISYGYEGIIDIAKRYISETQKVSAHTNSNNSISLVRLP